MTVCQAASLSALPSSAPVPLANYVNIMSRFAASRGCELRGFLQCATAHKGDVQGVFALAREPNLGSKSLFGHGAGAKTVLLGIPRGPDEEPTGCAL